MNTFGEYRTYSVRAKSVTELGANPTLKKKDFDKITNQLYEVMNKAKIDNRAIQQLRWKEFHTLVCVMETINFSIITVASVDRAITMPQMAKELGTSHAIERTPVVAQRHPAPWSRRRRRDGLCAAALDLSSLLLD
jgi:hypothetical protein